MTRDEKLAGDRVNRTTGTFSPPPPFEQTTKGFTFGGPIIKDKLFFFLNYEDFQWTPGPNIFTVGPIGTSLPTTFVSSTQVQAAVPAENVALAGTAALTVSNNTGRSNPQYFSVTPATIALTFSGAENSVASQPESLAEGDFNADGTIDLAAASFPFFF